MNFRLSALIKSAGKFSIIKKLLFIFKGANLICCLAFKIVASGSSIKTWNFTSKTNVQTPEKLVKDAKESFIQIERTKNMIAFFT